MNIKPRGNKRKGVALVFALFTTALLMSMSATVVALAMRHARDGGVANYSEAAIHAANWGIEAVINYMGEGGRDDSKNQLVWTAGVSTGFNQSYLLTEYPGDGRPALGNLVRVRVTRLRVDELPKYGLSYKVNQTVGEDAYREGDSRLVEFMDYSNPDVPYSFLYNTAANAQDVIFGRVSVVVTEMRYNRSSQPSQYQLVAVSRILGANGAGVAANTNRTSEGYVLASRVVEARVREETASDFMHFVQNARAWDVQGVNPNVNTLAADVVGMPEGYEENGRIRVDGLKVGGGITKPVADTSGNFRFYGQGNTDSTRWQFHGDVTMEQGRNTNQFDRGADNDINRIFGNGLNADADSLGMPQGANEDPNFDYNAFARERAQTGTGANLDISIRGDRQSAFRDSQNGGRDGSVPFVVASGLGDEDVRPSFAKVVVELNGSDVTVTMVNPAVPENEETLYSGKASNINGGIISVTGGNVEVRSATNLNGEPVPFTGNLTIVTDEDQGRADTTTDSIYSQGARNFFEDNPHLSPPYTEAQLAAADQALPVSERGKYTSGSSGGGASSYVWPALPSTSAVEREGNVFITGDIAYGEAPNNPPALGIVSKNFVLLNKTAQTERPSSTFYDSLSVDGVLMSLDHTVQFDWDNLAKNPGHANLLAQNRNRSFNLNGAIVSRFLDVEGDVKGRGYFKQGFQHDENLRFQLPPSFPRWDRTKREGVGICWNWVILNYIDNGTLNQVN